MTTQYNLKTLICKIRRREEIIIIIIIIIIIKTNED
jgi:hypothetical protein